MQAVTLPPITPSAARRPGFDKLGLVVAGLILAGGLLPFSIDKPNRIVPGEGVGIAAALPPALATALCAVLVAVGLAALLRTTARMRLATSFLALACIMIALGVSATYLVPPGNSFVRVSPGAGFWTLVFALALFAADALVRMELRPLQRIAILASVGAGLVLILAAGVWNDVSIMREYANRADTFWREAGTHVTLAFGSLVAATLVGVPLGILAYRRKRVRASLVNVLNIIQTMPSIALFGLLIAPLAWIAANVPGAAGLGIAGIGRAPALVALFGYSLLPIVANTLIGLVGVPASVKDAARGMGMMGRQVLLAAELPLAFPVILTGIRIVLVQNIGLATVAALIGGGGFGVFVFQGIGQTAMDLVLLGAVPTVALAFAAAIVLDALVEIVSTRRAASA